jgi:hypothetical protein
MNQTISGNDNAPGQNKVFTIFVNTREKQWKEKEITFREVVELAYDNPVFSEEVKYTVSYSKGEDKKPKGTLVDGGKSINVKDGMVFDVERSDRS